MAFKIEEVEISSFTNLLWKLFHNVMHSLISVLIFSLVVEWTNAQMWLQSETVITIEAEFVLIPNSNFC